MDGGSLLYLKRVQILNDQYLEIIGYVKCDLSQVMIKVDVFESWEKHEYVTSCSYVFGKDSECMKSYLKTVEELRDRDKLCKQLEIRLTALRSLGFPDFIRLQSKVNSVYSTIYVVISGIEEHPNLCLRFDSSVDDDVRVLHDKIVTYCTEYIQFLNSHPGFYIDDYYDDVVSELFDE